MLAAAFVGCDQFGPGELPDDPSEGKDSTEFALEVKTLAAGLVEFEVTAPKDGLEMAYILNTEPQAYSKAVLFRQGTVLEVSTGDIIRIDRNILQDTDYYLYAVAKLDEKNYSDIVEVEFTTPKYEFDRMLTVVETYLDGYKLHITVPEEVKERGNAIRYNSGTSKAFYNVLKGKTGDETFMILQGTVFNGNLFGNYTLKDTTLVRDDSNIVELDENGEPVLDEYGQMVDIHDKMAPGETVVLWAGECALGTDAEMGAIMNAYTDFKGESYVVPLFSWDLSDPYFDWDAATETGNYEGSGWTGAFQRIEFKIKEPEEYTPDFSIEVPKDKITATEAIVNFKMGEDVYCYMYMILDDATYNQMIELYLDGEKDELQWFLTSWLARYEWGLGAYFENTTVNAASSFQDGALIGGEDYHVICTVMGDELGSRQAYYHETFTAKAKVEDPPVIIVTPVYDEVKDAEGNVLNSAYNASFNIKAPNKDVEGAYWACNYAREFELAFNAGGTYETLLKGNYQLTAKELELLNSEEGLTLSFPTLDGEVMRFAIYGCNYEYTFNYIDEKVEGEGWADYKAPYVKPIAKIDSPLFDSLDDVWTATATIRVNQQLEDGSIVPYEMKDYKSKVIISNEIPGIPETLTEDVYKLYGDAEYSRSEVDAMYKELKTLADEFAKYRLAGQNRLLCSGFVDFDYYATSRVTLMTPYDLFTSTKYSSYDVPQIIYDFGPKWFLEVQQDGSVIVPFSSKTLPPMHSWPGYPFWTGGIGTDSSKNTVAFYDPNKDVKGFPVVVENDKITIKPIVLANDAGEKISYYMNALGVNGSSTEVEIVATVVSDIVLTRGWNGASAAKVASVAPSKAKAVTMSGELVKELPKARIYKSMTPLKAVPQVEYKVDETPDVVTMDMLNTTADKILKYFNVE